MSNFKYEYGNGILRKINSRFHVDRDGYIVKTSNNQRIPEDEPVFLFRGRDRLSLPMMHIYVQLCLVDGCNDYFLGEMDEPINELTRFKNEHPERMKQPGVTRGK